MQLNEKMLATSKAGHDKGKLYMVLGREGEQILLVNGTTKLLEHPKRKNQKHVQLIKHLPQEVADAMERIDEDADVKKVLSIYQSRA